MARTSLVAGALTFVACFSEEPLPSPAGESTDDGDTTSTKSTNTSLGTSTSGDSSSTTMQGTSSTTTVDDTVGPECSTDGQIDQACPPDAPYCFDGSCGPCTDRPGACADIDVGMPVCDQATGNCTRCTEHDQCESGACRLMTGACFDSTNRLWADAAADCAAATGTEDLPFCTIDDALNTIHAQPGADPWVVHVAGHANAYLLSEDASIPERPVAVIGPARGLSAVLVGSPPWHLATYGADGEAYLARLTLGGAFAAGTIVDCLGGNLFADDVIVRGGDTGLHVSGSCEAQLRRSTLTEAAGRAVDVDPSGRLTVESSEIHGNQGAMVTEGITTLRRSQVFNSWTLGGISVPSGTLTMTNCVMYSNVYLIGHIDLGPSATANLNYVVALGDPLSCGDPTSEYNIRNSIIGEFTCDAEEVTVDQSLVAPGDEGLGSGNVEFPPADYPLVFVGPDDFHILPNPPRYLLGIAVRSATDPAFDFDGDARPAVSEPDYPGIDAAP